MLRNFAFLGPNILFKTTCTSIQIDYFIWIFQQFFHLRIQITPFLGKGANFSTTNKHSMLESCKKARQESQRIGQTHKNVNDDTGPGSKHPYDCIVLIEYRAHCLAGVALHADIGADR